MNYSKDSSAKNSTFGPFFLVTCFPSNTITTARRYVTSKAVDRKNFSFGQQPLIFGNSSSMFGNLSQSVADSALTTLKSALRGFRTMKIQPQVDIAKIPTTGTTHIATSLIERSALTTNTGSENTGPFMDLSKTAAARSDFDSLAIKVAKDDKVMVALGMGNGKRGPFAKPLTGLTDAKNNQTGDRSAAENNFNGENCYPHYAPVITLPEEVVATTSEEEETKLFGERASLFRRDYTN
uniref:RanBD1 domain-containing protein n=1 Tax=Glossina austeni TaxID=7395 RepID=A0A1A9UCY5_GLOAU